jgi:hypothetical protein
MAVGMGSCLAAIYAQLYRERQAWHRSGRSSVTVKKKRSAETALLMPGGYMPVCACGAGLAKAA